MDSFRNLKYAVSVVGEWVFYSNYKKALPLNIDSLNLICAFFMKNNTLKIPRSVLCSKVCQSKIKSLFDILVNNYIYI